jgi:hypothetical protein
LDSNLGLAIGQVLHEKPGDRLITDLGQCNRGPKSSTQRVTSSEEGCLSLQDSVLAGNIAQGLCFGAYDRVPDIDESVEKCRILNH